MLVAPSLAARRPRGLSFLGPAINGPATTNPFPSIGGIADHIRRASTQSVRRRVTTGTGTAPDSLASRKMMNSTVFELVFAT
jgi:hypothetical protein